MPDHIRIERRGPVLIVTLARPDKLNSLHAPACRELDDAFDRFAADPELRVAILTGEGRGFCAGHDLVDAPDEPLPASGFGGLTLRPPIAKPLIAAVNGYAMGGGFEIALCCDLILAAPEAVFALSEPRVGAVAVQGGPQRLLRRLPHYLAMEMLLTGRRMGAEEAQRWGLVNHVTAPGEDLLATALEWAGRVLECAPASLGHTKMLAMQRLEGEDFVAAIAADRAPIAAAMFASHDLHEGIAAMREKRTPRWTGR